MAVSLISGEREIPLKAKLGWVRPGRVAFGDANRVQGCEKG